MTDYGPDTPAGQLNKMLEDIVAAYRAGDEVEGVEAGQYLREWPLDIELHATRSLGDHDPDWNLNSVEVLLGCGGPTEWVEFRDVDRATVHKTHLPKRSAMDMDMDVAETLAAIWGLTELLTGDMQP